MKFRLNLNTKVSLLTLALLPLMVSLGLWQLSRAEQKNQIQNDFNDRANLVANSLPSDTTDINYLSVRLEGAFDNERVFFLDNRTYQGRVGYEVLLPFTVSTGELVLVNRGWVQAPATRAELPPIEPAQQAIIEGQFYRPDKPTLLLEEQDYSNQTWPIVIQSVEMETLSRLLAAPLYPYQVRLKAESFSALTADWPVVTTSPEKHTAYAVQWFAMAVALVLWFVFANTNLWQCLSRTPET